LENDKDCTLTLWNGGCRVTSIAAALEEPRPQPVLRTKRTPSTKATAGQGPRMQKNLLPTQSRSTASFSNSVKAEAKGENAGF